MAGGEARPSQSADLCHRKAGWFAGGIRVWLIGALLLPLIPLFVLDFFSLTTHLRLEQQRLRQENLEVAREEARIFDNMIDAIFREDHALGDEMAGRQPLAVQQANRELAESASIYPTIMRKSWVSPQGRVLACSDPQAVGTSVGDRPYFQSIRAGSPTALHGLYQPHADTPREIAMASGVRGQNGELRGVMINEIDPARLSAVMAVRRADGGTILIVDNSGLLVYAYPAQPNWTGRKWTALDPLAAHALQDDKEETGAVAARDGAPSRVEAFTPIEQTGWLAGADTPSRPVMALERRRMVRQIGLLLFIDLMAVLAVVLVSYKIVKPIRQLQDDVSTIGCGVLEHRATPDGPCEIMELGEAFNRMARELQQQRAEREHMLAELEATLGAIVDGMVIYNTGGEITRMNETARRILCYQVSDCRSFPERVAAMHIRNAEGHPFKLEELPFSRAQRGEVVQGILMELHPAPEQTYWVSASAAPICSPEGASEGVIALFTDISSLQELRQRQEVYIHTISHDLRNPLSSIHGHAQVLQRLAEDAPVDERFHQSIDAILRGTRRMNVMIQDLVDVARSEGGQLQLDLHAVDLAGYLEELLQRSETAMDVGRIQLNLPANLPPVLADYDRLERILVNLVSNALKYSAPNSPVLISAEPRGRALVVAVRDFGVGIPAEELPRLFQPYYRSPEGRKTEGIGLGLYITRILVEAHGGSVWAESTLGEGSTFCFTLPLK